MRTFSAFLGPLFGLALLVALVAGVYFLFEYVIGIFAGLESQARTLAAICSVVVLLAAVIVAEGLKARGQVDRPAAAEKTVTYERLLFFCCEWLKRPASPDARTADEQIIKLEHSLLLRGNAKVISIYTRLRCLAKRGVTPNEAEWTLLNTLVTEMRSDLGMPPLRRQSDLLELLGGPAPEGILKAASEPGQRHNT